MSSFLNFIVAVAASVIALVVAVLFTVLKFIGGFLFFPIIIGMIIYAEVTDEEETPGDQEYISEDDFISRR